MQHDPATLPGAEHLLETRPPGSIAAMVHDFLVHWVALRQVTTRRAYERALVLLLRDLADNGPFPRDPAQSLTGSRLADHLQWRVDHGLADSAELIRGAVHLARLADWFEAHGTGAMGVTRDQLRAVAQQLAQPRA